MQHRSRREEEEEERRGRRHRTEGKGRRGLLRCEKKFFFAAAVEPTDGDGDSLTVGGRDQVFFGRCSGAASLIDACFKGEDYSGLLSPKQVRKSFLVRASFQPLAVKNYMYLRIATKS